MPHLKSSAAKKGKTVTQIIIGTSGLTKTYSGILTNSIVEGKFCKMELNDGRLLMVNTANVLFVEVFNEE